MLRLLTFSEDPQENQLVTLPRRKGTPLWHGATILHTLRNALREGFAAHRRYEHLTSRGYRVNAAIRTAFGLWQPGVASEDQCGCRDDCLSKRHCHQPLAATA
jgi:hypothetical protein